MAVEPGFYNGQLHVHASSGVVDSQRLAQLLAQAAKGEDGRPRLRNADFSGARIVGAQFYGVTFDGSTSFVNATLLEGANFNGATFNGEVQFDHAVLDGQIEFQRTRFAQNASFLGASFDAVYFQDAEFSGATFSYAKFCRAGSFFRTHFRGEAHFKNSAFLGDGFSGGFSGSKFEARIDLEGATFRGVASMDRAHFSAATAVGPLLAMTRLSCDHAVFEGPVQIRASTAAASFQGTEFRGGADIHLRWAVISLEEASFHEPSVISGLSEARDFAGKRVLGNEAPVWRGVWWCPPTLSRAEAIPRLASVRRARVDRLRLSGVDLQACRFAGAHGLDTLNLDDVRFAEPPGGWRRVRWTRRQTVAEEHIWRARRAYGQGWITAPVQEPHWLLEADDVLEAAQIADTYRALRKSREDHKDEPGAADFYYGEMEMRRRSGRSQGFRDAIGRSSTPIEQGLLTLYWGVSGYGLRASRSIIALILLIVSFTVAFHLYGFRDPVRPYAARSELRPSTPYDFPPEPADVADGLRSFEAWTYSAGTATAIVGAPDAQLTSAGRGLRIVLRVLGPVLVALTLLAIRGRVKR